jgi:hypothetical protein
VENNERVVNHLERINPDLAENYLEHLVNDRQEPTAEFHHRLILLYLTKVLQSKEWRQYEKELQQQTTANKQRPLRFNGDQTRVKLLEFLQRSANYRPERILSRFPESGKLQSHRPAYEFIIFNRFVRRTGDNIITDGTA